MCLQYIQNRTEIVCLAWRNTHWLYRWYISIVHCLLLLLLLELVIGVTRMFTSFCLLFAVVPFHNYPSVPDSFIHLRSIRAFNTIANSNTNTAQKIAKIRSFLLTFFINCFLFRYFFLQNSIEHQPAVDRFCERKKFIKTNDDRRRRTHKHT